MARRGKLKLAVWKFASCDGCQLTLLNCEQELLAMFSLSDSLRPDAVEAIEDLRQLGLKPLLYSGDSEAAVAGVAGAAALAGMRFSLPRLFRPRAPRPLGAEAARFVRECFTGIDRTRLWDVHVHAIGLGAGGTGCWWSHAGRCCLSCGRSWA